MALILELARRVSQNFNRQVLQVVLKEFLNLVITLMVMVLKLMDMVRTRGGDLRSGGRVRGNVA